MFDPNGATTWSAKTHHMNVDYNPYEGRTCKGAVETVLSRGEVVVEKGKLVGKPGRGQYVKRNPRSA